MIPLEAANKIKRYREEGYSDQDIVTGISQSKNFPKLAMKVQTYVKEGYSSEDIMTGLSSAKVGKGLKKPPQQMAEEMMGQMTGPEQPGRPFNVRYPKLWAAGKTLEAIPETIAHGMTLGLSSKVKEMAHIVATGEALPEDQRYEDIPSKTAGELVGATVPIGTAGKFIAKPIINAVSKSKYFKPFAKMVGWGTAGSAYSTAEKLVSEGELPSVKEIAKHGAAWAAFEGAMSTLGWGGRLTLGVNRLAKTWGIPRKEVLKTILAEAKKRKMPIARYAYAKAGVQKALGEAEKRSAQELLEGFEKLGTYPDLTRQLADQEVSARIKSFKSYAGKGVVIGGKQPKPKQVITPQGEIERILNKAGATRTAEEVALLNRTKPGLKLPVEKPVKETKLFPKKKPEAVKALMPPVTKVYEAKAPQRLLPAGQGFVLKSKPPTTKPQPPKLPKPKPSGAAGLTKKGKGIGEVGGKGGTTLGFGPAGEIQKMYDALLGKVKSKVQLRQNKYAGSINVKKQKVKQSYKEFQQEVSALTPKKTQTWDQTGKLSKEIVADYKKGAKVLTKAKKGQALTAVEIDAARQINVNAINKLKEIAETKTPEQMNEQFANYVDDVFKPLSNASSEAGRALNIHKKEISPQRIAKAFAKLKKGLNARQLKEFKELNTENPLEVKRFLDRLPDPKFRDYFYEYWYNSILSGVPTHIVNVASNTGWAAFQLGVHRPLKAIIDAPIAALTGKQRRYYLNETIPAIVAYGKAFKKGMKGAGEMAKKGNISQFENKWEREIGSSVLGAFERSPHKVLRNAAPFITAPTRALRAMDVWANTMAYDSHIAALSRRAANVKGLKGDARKAFEQKLMLNPSEKMRMKSTEFAKHLTFTDDPGKITQIAINARSKVPFGRIVVPFVNTIANLTKRGVEMTPVVGLSLARGKTPAKILAQQIEGSILGFYVLSKVQNGEITGAAPKNKAARERFYAQGKKPWAVKMGGSWYQYRRVEPFNTVIASVAIAHDKIMNAKDDATRTEIFGTMVEGLMENVLDSSYLQGVSNILDRHGRRQGMVERTAASFVPYSSFWRSINRAYEVATTGKTLVRDTRGFLGAFSQVIPGLSDKAPARLTVWGEEIPLEGGIFRQWLPYKWSKEKHDSTEKMLEELGIYPGHPKQTVTVKGRKVKLPDNIYKNYCLTFGHKAKKRLDFIVTKSKFRNKKDRAKKDEINRVLIKERYKALQKAKREFMRK